MTVGRIYIMKRALFFMLIVVAAAACADEHWTLITSDFHQSTISLLDMDDAGAKVIPSGKPQTTVPTDRVLRLDKLNAGAPLPARLTAHLLNGDRLGGEPGNLKDDLLQWNSPSAGELKLPLSTLRAITRLTSLPAPPRDLKQDQVILSNHDVVRGILTGIEAGTILVQNGGETLKVPVSSAETIFFATSPKPAAKSTREWRMRLVDSSVFTAASIRMKEARLLWVSPGQTAADERSTDLANVLSIEQVNGPVSWLSDREPTINRQTPFISEAALPARMNLNVFGKPLRAGPETFATGIGVHANSTLTFPLDGGYKTFRTRYAIDTTADASKAAVNIRILLDGHVVHEQKDFRAFKISPVVTIDLGAAKELTLEVIAAGATDAQDRLDWIEAALVRDPAPTTQPAR